MSTAKAMPALRCPVCLDQYSSSSRAPLALFCGHVTCAQCTSQLLQKHAILKCPECKLLTHSVPSKCVPLIDTLRCLNVLATDDVPPPEHDPWANPPNNDYELDKCILHHAVQLLLDMKEDLQASLQRFSGDENKLFHLKCEHANLVEVIDSTIDALCTTTTKYVNVRDHITQLILRIEHAQPGPGTFLPVLGSLCDYANVSYSGTCLHASTSKIIPGLRTAIKNRFVKPPARIDPSTTTFAPDDCHHNHRNGYYHYDEPRRYHDCGYDDDDGRYRYSHLRDRNSETIYQRRFSITPRLDRATCFHRATIGLPTIHHISHSYRSFTCDQSRRRNCHTGTTSSYGTYPADRPSPTSTSRQYDQVPVHVTGAASCCSTEPTQQQSSKPVREYPVPISALTNPELA